MRPHTSQGKSLLSTLRRSCVYFAWFEGLKNADTVGVVLLDSVIPGSQVHATVMCLLLMSPSYLVLSSLVTEKCNS